VRALAAWLAAAVALALLGAELSMQPTTADRVRLVSVFVGTGLGTGLVAWWLVTRHGRSRSLRWSLTLVAVLAVAVAAGAVVVSAVSMFLSPHDLRLVLIALGLGVLLALGLSAVVVERLTGDLTRLAEVADRIGDGDLAARSRLDRSDEVGVVGRAVDRMADRLDEAEQRRVDDEASRRALLTGVSHDLRTPLTSARVALEAVRDGVAEDPDRYLGSAVRDLELAGRLVDDLFLLAQLRGGEVRLDRMRVAVEEVADGVVEELTPLAAARGVRLEVAAAGRAEAEVDPHAIGRVVRNLVDNAVRHAPPGSTVTIRVGADGEDVDVVVTDEGPGFSPEVAAAAGAAPLERPDATGFGLAIAGGLVRAHGGDLTATAGPGGRVAFRLPATADRA
jgi:signal transduction histidine kinase